MQPEINFNAFPVKNAIFKNLHTIYSAFCFEENRSFEDSTLNIFAWIKKGVLHCWSIVIKCTG